MSGDKCFATQQMSMNGQKSKSAEYCLGLGVYFCKQVNSQIHLPLEQHRFNCTGPLLCGIFSTVNTTVLHDSRGLNLWMRNNGYGRNAHMEGRLQITQGFLTVQRVGAPNTLVVQGSTVLNPRIVMINYNLFQEIG